jgi:hypothetical protein
VRLDGLLGDDQAGGYLRVRQALRDEAQDLRLARGEGRQRPGGRGLGPRAQAGELADQAPGDGRREQSLAGRDHPHGLEQPLGGDILEQEAAGPGAQRVVHIAVQVEGGQDEDPRARAPVRPGSGELPGGLDAVHDGHAHVHQDDVGGQLAADLHRLGPVAGGADHREVRLGVQQRGEAGAHHVVIVGDDDPDGRRHTGHQDRGVETRAFRPGRTRRFTSPEMSVVVDSVFACPGTG